MCVCVRACACVCVGKRERERETYVELTHRAIKNKCENPVCMVCESGPCKLILSHLSSVVYFLGFATGSFSTLHTHTHTHRLEFQADGMKLFSSNSIFKFPSAATLNLVIVSTVQYRVE